MPDLEGWTLSSEQAARDEVWQVALIPGDMGTWSLGEAPPPTGRTTGRWLSANTEAPPPRP